MSRMWFLDKDSWTAEDISSREFQTNSIPFEETTAAVPEAPKELTVEESLAQRNLVIAREDQMSCPACGEQFNQFWDTDMEEWLCKEAVLGEDDLIYHTLCAPRDSVDEYTTDINNPSMPEVMKDNGAEVKVEEPKTPDQGGDGDENRGTKRPHDELYGSQAEFSPQEKKPRTDTN